MTTRRDYMFISVGEFSLQDGYSNGNGFDPDQNRSDYGALRSCETCVSISQSTRRNIPEDGHLHSRSRQKHGLSLKIRYHGHESHPVHLIMGYMNPFNNIYPYFRFNLF
jgi:hypothetical protein